MRLKKISQKKNLTFYSVDSSVNLEVPLFNSSTSAGFPSPADDYIEMKLDLNRHVIKNIDATYYVRVNGDSMKDAMINDGALLVVDRSINPSDNSIAVCSINGEFTVKRIIIKEKEIYLKPENDKYNLIKVSEFDDFLVWGIVTYVIQKPL
jgi:DNA polymerase V